ncbi:MAG: ribonuclease III [Limisphaera sp.]|nr:ribonuclease III [Limisphaera sp.]
MDIPGDTQSLEARLGWRFRQRELLAMALTHPSVAADAQASLATNQRLEFLGDAVLGMILSQALYQRYPAYEEGRLTKARARLVNRRTLAERARALELGKYLVLSPGEERLGGRQRSSALADAYEALVGALYLDGGLEAAREFVLREFESLLARVESLPWPDNPKGELQELLQAESPHPPEYRTLSVSGPDHARIFECAVWHQGRELGRGKGPSKKAAESEAALEALRRLQGQPAQLPELSCSRLDARKRARRSTGSKGSSQTQTPGSELEAS